MLQFISSVLVIVAVVSCVLAQPNCSQPPPLANVKQCCAKQATLPDLSEACQKKINPSGPGMNHCFAECVFNETGILSNGQLMMDKAKAMFAQKYKDSPEMIPVMEAAMTKCDSKIKEKMATMKAPPPPPGAENCSPFSAMIMHCTLNESFINCPATLWQNTEPCNNAKEFAKACPMKPPGA